MIKLWFGILLVLGASSFTWGKNIEDLYFLDASGNHLFSLNFQYADNLVTGRTVLDKNNFVLSFTTFEVSGGVTQKEFYTDPQGQVDLYSAYNYTSNSKSGSLYNKFDELLYQYSYPLTASDNKFAIKDAGSNVKQTFEYLMTPDDEIERIKVFDEKGALTHSVLVRYEGMTSVRETPRFSEAKITSIKKISDSQVVVSFKLHQTGKFRALLYTLSGRLIKKWGENKFGPGTHSLTIDLTDEVITTGTYVLSFELDNVSFPYKMRLVK